MKRSHKNAWPFLMLSVVMLAAPMVMAATITTQPPVVVYPPAVASLYPQGIGFNPVVDYTKPHFAQSPNIRKFVDSLPGLGVANRNNLGQYIPVAVPDTTSYPGSDYYEIGLKQFTQKMNTDLPPTALRGYYQKNGPDASTQYLGAAVIAHRNTPVRLKFINELGVGTLGDLPLPVDTGVMGAGMGPVTGQMYNQNRSDVHLHGGLTPWISDGTPHQWVTPAGDGTPYKKGDSFQNVPDMVNNSVVNGTPVPCIGGGKCFTAAAGDGIGTYFYPNQQSSRLMFYHDHSYGITRLNVYAGIAAPYLLVDQVEEDLLAGTNVSGGNPAAKQILPDMGGVYHYGIPLVIQDKAFVNDATTPPALGFPALTSGYVPTPATLTTDPLWQYWAGTGGGNLWFPHEYMPIENMFDPTGNSTNGRYDYAPFMNPPMVPMNLTLPSPTIVPEAFVDTAVVNGTAFPYVELPPDAIRFRILNASNDRSLNLQLYKADPLRLNVTNGGANYNAPVVTITGNAGTYTSAKATVSPGTISSIDVVGATHYIFAPTVTLTGGGGTCTSVFATLPSNTSGTIDITAQGCIGFISAPTVTITGGGGGTYTSATATIIPRGVISGITILGATGYRSDLPVPTVSITDATGTGAAAAAFVNTELKMVDAAPNPTYPTWPSDGRDGGVPDPTTAGPPWVQIGNEGGLMAQAVVWPQQPVAYEQTRQNIPTLGVTSRTLLLMPAMRADVIVDLSGYKDGDTLILYNDSPAPMPGFWAIDDYYTDDPDQTAVGGAPTTPPGFGPNTRTVMQIRIKGAKTSAFTFDLNAIKTALPKAFAVAQDKPLVPQMVYNDAYPGFATFDTYAQNFNDNLNLTGVGQFIARIKTTIPGNNYVTSPQVSIVGGGGKNATATAGLNPCGGITLLTTGAGYTTPPTVTIGAPATTYTAPAAPPAGVVLVAPTAVATVSGAQVNAITINEPGSYYNVNPADLLAIPTCTIAPPTGCTINTTTCVQATCSSFIAVANTVGSIRITNAGTGYTSQPYVYLTGGGGMGAKAEALLNGSLTFTGKNLTEGFDPDYGRMDVRLGSTPSPLTPNVGNGMVLGIARYIDPPTEILNDGETVLWRLTHLGVDSHSMHFHLFNVQVVNRVDFTNVVKPPYPDEIGWRETIRTNPMEDIIVAIKPVTSMSLPFPVPDSVRLLDVTNPVNVNTNFLPVAPPVGIPAVPQVTNVMTNFGWEYVWHCHLLGHEENDMMRPLVLIVPRASVTQRAIAFGDQVITKASVARTVTLSNGAGAPLLVNSIGFSGTNPTDFSQTNTCGTKLAAGASCTVSVRFTPTAAGARAASLDISSNDPASPMSVQLTGNGVLMGVDVTVSTDRSTAFTTITSPAFSTTTSNQLLLAFVSAGSPSATAPATTVTGVTINGGGLTWTLVRRTNTQRGSAEIWRAFAPTALTTRTVTATINQSVPSGQITVVSYIGADLTGAGSGAIGATGSANALSGAPSASLVTTRAGSLVYGVGDDWTAAIARTVGKNQTMVHQLVSPTADTYWVQRQNNAVPSAGTTVFIDDTAPTTDRYNLTTVEIRLPAVAGPAASLSASTLTFGNQVVATTTPTQTATLTNAGTALLTINSIGLSGTNSADFPLTNGCGASLAAGASCNMTVSFTPGALGARSASLNISTNDPTSPTLSVSLTGTGVNPGLIIDATVATDTTGTASLASPSFSTTSTNELLLAFVAASTPTSTSPATTVTGITGGGLTWVLVGRTNTQRGTTEIWRAFASLPLANTIVTATLNQSVPSGSITVVSFAGVDTTGTSGSGAIGATGTANALTGAPSASLVTTRANSWVFGVGNDWDFGAARTLGANQTMVHQYLAPTSDTYWVQRQTSPTPLAATTVTINDTAPTTDQYNLTIVEVRTP